MHYSLGMTINQLINEVAGAEFQTSVRQAATELASVQAGCGVHTLFRPSVVDLETGRNGLRWLIARILKEAGAEHPKYNAKTQAFRNVYVATGLTKDAIVKRVRACNGFDKYPDSTIEDNLYVVMQRAGQVDKVTRTSREDSKRTCQRPRCVWYLVQS